MKYKYSMRTLLIPALALFHASVVLQNLKKKTNKKLNRDFLIDKRGAKALL